MGYYNPTESILKEVQKPQSGTRKRKIQNIFSNPEPATREDLEAIVNAFEGNSPNKNSPETLNPLLTNQESSFFTQGNIFGFNNLEEDHGISEIKNHKRSKSKKPDPKKTRHNGGKRRKTRKMKKTKW